MTEITLSRQRLFRKNLVIPTEHGSWSWLLVPFVAGAAAAGPIAGAGSRLALVPLALTLVGGLSAFLMRQPATVWLRIRRGRARPADEPLAAGWTLSLASVAGLCLVGLLVQGRVALLWLMIPFTGVLLLYLGAARSGRARVRALWTELIGALGLALMAPAAVIAANGTLTWPGWVLWGLMGLQNALGVLYVRIRLADTHKRPTNRAMVIWGHVAGLIAVIVAGLLGWAPLLTVVPFAALLGRGVWAAQRPRPIVDVRRFGFTEVGVEILSGAWIVASYWIG